MWNLYSITTNQDAIRRFSESPSTAPEICRALRAYSQAPVVRNQSGGRELVKMR
jgi:hypothetical protein